MFTHNAPLHCHAPLCCPTPLHYRAPSRATDAPIPILTTRARDSHADAPLHLTRQHAYA